MVNLRSLLRIQGLSPFALPGPFPMPLQTHIRSPLSSAAPISRLRRAKAQEGGTILFFGFLSQAKLPVRSPGSAGADQAPED